MAGRGKPVGTKLYVGNLPETCRRVDLQKLFEKYGSVVECDIVKDYGFIHFSTPDEAKAAADGLNNANFEGVTLKVELSRSTVRHKPGMGKRGECIRCGAEGHWSKDCPKGPSRPRGGERFRSDPYQDPYDRYYDRYMPPPPERYRPYADPYERARPLPPRDPYYRERDLRDPRDPYARPPPEYYGRSRSPPPPRDYYYYERQSYRLPPAPPGTGRLSPVRSRVGPY